MRKLAALALLCLIGACGPKTAPAPPVVTAPKFPEFLRPTVPTALASGMAPFIEERGWQYLQGGDLRSAEREFELALKATPGFYPAEASLGFVELARKDGKASLSHFDRALQRDPRYLSALVGRADALLALNREADALEAFESALAVDPTLVEIKDRIDVLKFRLVEQHLAAARELARAGRLDEAARAYTSAIARSPDSAILYRELAAVERQEGELQAALADFRKAVLLDPNDASSLVQIGDLLDRLGDFDAASTAYTQALALEPNDAVEGKLEKVRARLELSRLPEEYRAIDAAPQITRGDLAALIGIRLAPLVQSARRREGVVITDLRNHWAATWIMAVARAGLMEPFANHAFQPRAIVRRIDLAQTIARLLTRTGATGARAQGWQASRVKFSDLSPNHLAYPAASIAVASGVMTLGADGSFQPSKPVTGAEAEEAISRIETLLSPAPSTGRKRQ